jgi:addiction module HigA family antidote
MEKIINKGGINGTGEGVVNTNSEDYKALKKAIQEHTKQQTKQEQIRYRLIGLKLQMESYIDAEQPSKMIHSGIFLKKYLKAINVKNKTFANFIELEEANLSMIINGKRKINTEFAYKLGQLFNINPNYWLLIQSKNELLEIVNNEQIVRKKYQLSDLLEIA